VLVLDLLKRDEAALNVRTINTENVNYELVSKNAIAPATSEKIMELISARVAAKLCKDYVGADAIRGKLKEIGVEVKDLPGGKIQCIVNEK
jgi:cysteinyl-tRNA synthetase